MRLFLRNLGDEDRCRMMGMVVLLEADMVMVVMEMGGMEEEVVLVAVVVGEVGDEVVDFEGEEGDSEVVGKRVGFGVGPFRKTTPKDCILISGVLGGVRNNCIMEGVAKSKRQSDFICEGGIFKGELCVRKR